MEQEDGKCLIVTVLMCQGVFRSPTPCACPHRQLRAWWPTRGHGWCWPRQGGAVLLEHRALMTRNELVWPRFQSCGPPLLRDGLTGTVPDRKTGACPRKEKKGTTSGSWRPAKASCRSQLNWKHRSHLLNTPSLLASLAGMIWLKHTREWEPIRDVRSTDMNENK